MPREPGRRWCGSHKCGTGPNNYSLDEYCPYCQRRRCHQCTVQEIQVRVDH
ncbi:hypothetical protein CTA2_716 [Colletotrichum tanaceti]|nr:hypothetical protein CTA2_716 [Colletotrichum tanaceti]